MRNLKDKKKYQNMSLIKFKISMITIITTKYYTFFKLI